MIRILGSYVEHRDGHFTDKREERSGLCLSPEAAHPFSVDALTIATMAESSSLRGWTFEPSATWPLEFFNVDLPRGRRRVGRGG